MIFNIITKYSFIILSYEIITLEIVKNKLIDIFLDKLIYIILFLIFYLLGLSSHYCCTKYSSEEKEILKLIRAGDKMNQLNNSGVQYYERARNVIDKSLPFTDISDTILDQMIEIEGKYELGQYRKRRKKKAD